MRIALLLALLLAGCSTQQTLTPFPPGLHQLPPATSPALTLRNRHHLILDFTNVTLRGSDPATPDEQRTGTALLLEDCSDITVRNLSAHGFRTAILARQVPGLRIEHCDFSDNYRPLLKSTPAKESNDDWLFFHHNESDEWSRYSAAIYLADCPYPNIQHTTVQRGFNALLLTRCNNALIANNTFIFNSGLGIGLYRSSHNAVMHNRLDFNVRGYSHNIYSRGQDSAAILVYEQSSNNLFAYNSATHSGDGFFLWAGQSTMDSAAGGCNDNVIFANDFSCAPTNGIEATFSRNYFIANRADNCDNGIWAGYSYDSTFAANTLSNNRTAIAIERGQHNLITANTFTNNPTPIRLFTRPEDKNWGYPKHHDTQSHDYQISNNVFTQATPLAVILQNTTNVTLTNNTSAATRPTSRPNTLVKADANSTFTLTTTTTQPPDYQAEYHTRFPPLPHAQDTTYPPTWPHGRQHIQITNYGPKDIRPPTPSTQP